MLFLVCNSSQVENHLDFAEQEHSRSGQSTAAPRETLRALALMTAFTLLSTLLISAVRPRQRQKLWKRASCAGVASATHHPANARTQPLAAAARTAMKNITMLLMLSPAILWIFLTICWVREKRSLPRERFVSQNEDYFLLFSVSRLTVRGVPFFGTFLQFLTSL